MDIPNCLRGYFEERELREANIREAEKLPMRPANRVDIKALYAQLGRPRDFVEFWETALNLGLVFVDVDRYPIKEKAVAAVPMDVARHERVLPIRISHNTLFLAIPDPSDLDHIRRLSKTVGLRVVPVICDLEALDRAINRYYPVD